MVAKKPDNSGKPIYEVESSPTVGTVIEAVELTHQKSPTVIDKDDILKYGQNKPRREIIYAKIEKREKA